jgi:hypothetical protein
MRIFVLDITIIELYSIGGFPLEEAIEPLLSVIKVLFLALFWYCFDYIIASLPFLAKIFLLSMLFYILNTTGGHYPLWWLGSSLGGWKEKGKSMGEGVKCVKEKGGLGLKKGCEL